MIKITTLMTIILILANVSMALNILSILDFIPINFYVEIVKTFINGLIVFLLSILIVKYKFGGR